MRDEGGKEKTTGALGYNSRFERILYEKILVYHS